MLNISLYLHFPWCLKKCPYCDFNSHVGFSSHIESEYILAIINELNYQKKYLINKNINTIFMGGGTPSLFSSNAIAKILEYISQNFNLSTTAEISLEANPGTFEVDKFRSYRNIGINRLSLGIQSFNNNFLQALGRVHNSAEAINATKNAREIFANINFDLMFALPNQNIKNVYDDINCAVSFFPDHLSFYELTIEPNTYFYRYPPKQLTEDEKDDIATEVLSKLAEHGFNRYEISAYTKNAQPKYCAHNTNYWQYGDYLGIGAGAHSKITEDNKIFRWENIKHPQIYINNWCDINKISPPKKQLIPQSEIPFEFMMNALRLKYGFKISLFEEKTGINISKISDEITQAEKLGLITIADEKIIPSEFGYKNLNRLIEIFINIKSVIKK